MSDVIVNMAQIFTLHKLCVRIRECAKSGIKSGVTTPTACDPYTSYTTSLKNVTLLDVIVYVCTN